MILINPNDRKNIIKINKIKTNHQAICNINEDQNNIETENKFYNKKQLINKQNSLISQSISQNVNKKQQTKTSN